MSGAYDSPELALVVALSELLVSWGEEETRGEEEETWGEEETRGEEVMWGEAE